MARTTGLSKQASWSGYNDASVSNWYFNNTGAFADPSSQSANGNQVIESSNTGMGTVTSYTSGAAVLPGIKFTPPRVGKYRIRATIATVNPAGQTLTFQLTDGTAPLDEVTVGTNSGAIAAQNGPSLDGILTVTSLSQVTIKIQGKISTGSCPITVTSQSTRMITWLIEEINLPC